MLIETVTTRGSAPAVNDDRQLGLHGQTWRFAFEAALTEQLEAKQAAPEPGLSTPEHEDAGRRRLDAESAGQARADGAQGRHDGGKDALHNTTELRSALATAAVAAGSVPVGGEVRAVPERLGVDALPAGPHGVPVASDLPFRSPVAVMPARHELQAPVELPLTRSASEQGGRLSFGQSNLFLEHTERGPVLWIRDLTTPAAQLHSAVMALLDEIRARGINVAAVRVNGAELASLLQFGETMQRDLCVQQDTDPVSLYINKDL